MGWRRVRAGNSGCVDYTPPGQGEREAGIARYSIRRASTGLILEEVSARTPIYALLLAVSLGGVWSARGASEETPATEAPVADAKHRGMSYAHSGGRRGPDRGYGSDASAESLRLLEANGVNWISVMPYAYQAAPTDTDIRWGTSRDGTDPDERFRRVTRQAHDLGIKVMMKPHVWLRRPAWVGMIEHQTETDWATWFDAYSALILHYARLAQETGADAFCIGNEFEKTTVREAQWRALIAEIREVYDGPLTYGAGFEGVYDVPFWDALDFIGLSAYFRLVDGRSPDRQALVEAWQPMVSRLGALARQWDRTVVFTELGYRSADFATEHPWLVDREAPVNLDLQVEAYEAFFEAVWPQPWFGGVYWWKWFTHLDHGGLDDNDYSPHLKPAERVLRDHYLEDATN